MRTFGVDRPEIRFVTAGGATRFVHLNRRCVNRRKPVEMAPEYRRTLSSQLAASIKNPVHKSARLVLLHFLN